MRAATQHGFKAGSVRITGLVIAALATLSIVALPGRGAGPATPPADGAKPVRKIVLIAGKKSHGLGAHEYEKGCRLIKACLDSSPNVKGIETVVVTNGWPADEKILDDADSIFLFCDGSDNGEDRHPLLKDDRLQTLGKLMDRGVGFAILHYTIFVPTNHGGKEFQSWVGGYFDYDSLGPSTPKTHDKWYSTLGEAETTSTPMATNHPILRGVKPFTTRTENYWKIHFLDNDPRLTPLLTFDPAKAGPPRRIGGRLGRRTQGRRQGVRLYRRPLPFALADRKLPQADAQRVAVDGSCPGAGGRGGIDAAGGVQIVHCAVHPPSTNSAEPVTNDDASEARNTAAPVIS